MENKQRNSNAGRAGYIKTACGALILTAFSAPAGAVPLLGIAFDGDEVPGVLGTGEPHDVGETNGQFGWYAADLIALDNVYLTAEYLGKEAGWTNEFSFGGSTIFNTASSSAGDTANLGVVSAGLIDFALSVIVGGNGGLSVANGSNVAGGFGIGDYGALNFWLGYMDNDPNMNSVWIAFDDGGGYFNGSLDDDDHDDTVVKITARAVQVPEPGTLSLLGAGLLLTGFAGYRRRA